MDVSLLKELIGVPYKPMGRDLSGIDCYGLCLYIYRRMGITLPDYIQYDDTEIETNNLIMREMEATIPNEKLEKPEVGCIIEFNIFGVPSHIGVYIGNGEFIHASKTHGVCIDKLYNWNKRVKGFYRVKA